MRLTIFTTPILSPLLKRFSIWVLRLAGWTLVGQMPSNTPKSVVIAAPHTSNWDLPYTLMVALALDLNIHWMGKIQIFRFPFKGLMFWLGGIAVDRSQSTNMVFASAQTLRDADGELHLVVPPEGTRSQSRHWKTGFYYIALQAQVPIVLGFLDFGSKTSGLGPALLPTGDLETDMASIKAFY
ncbi:MAG: glycerol acyltransferase, partial [Betaproteobacteria bacterium]|nr:glycerol acyltransferase [Betaproteobacteria bacterium]